jgi:aminoglycoside phosphotransferase (APT) family kinase protein
MFEDIDISLGWKSVVKISKGWSSDEKYMIITKSGNKQLLRLASIDKYEDKKKEYEIIIKYSKTGINMSMPIAFGICNHHQSVYMILSWVEGQDLEEVLPGLSIGEQYYLGRMTGEILRKIHGISVSENDMPSETKKNKKLLQLSKYEKSNVRIADDEIAVKFVYDNIDKIWNEKPVYQHGDFHPGNLIYMEDGTIGVIDFNRWEVGDPYEEFYKLESFGVEISIPYCIGQIESYFKDDIPDIFWSTLAVYVAHASLYSIQWAEKFGQTDIDGMVKRCLEAFKDYDYFRLAIPKWYKSIHKHQR